MLTQAVNIIVKLWLLLTLVTILLPCWPCFAQDSVKLPLSKWKPLAFNELAPQFGTEEVGKSGQFKIISITNVSDSPLFLLQIQATDEFEENSQCPTWLPEGWTCLIYITFSPRAPGTGTGQLYVDGTKANAPGVWTKPSFSQTIPLSGFGLAAANAKGTSVQDQEKLGTAARRTTNEEEAAYALDHSSKPFTYEDILHKNPDAIAYAIGDDKKLFALTKDTKSRLQHASFLLSLGVKDSIYFEYLRDEATKVLGHDRDLPWPVLYDARDLSKESVNPAFVEWCKQRRLGIWQIEKSLSYEVPDAMQYLAASGDPRYYDLLIQGLQSQNPLVVWYAAVGLAKVGDPRAIDELIAVGRRNSAAVLGVMQALIYFSEPRAQAAAEEFASKYDAEDMLRGYRDEKKERGLRALFPW